MRVTAAVPLKSGVANTGLQSAARVFRGGGGRLDLDDSALSCAPLPIVNAIQRRGIHGGRGPVDLAVAGEIEVLNHVVVAHEIVALPIAGHAVDAIGGQPSSAWRSKT